MLGVKIELVGLPGRNIVARNEDDLNKDDLSEVLNSKTAIFKGESFVSRMHNVILHTFVSQLSNLDKV